jgi:peroxiredoxin
MTRWILAAATAVVGGVMTVPLLLGDGEPLTSRAIAPVASHEGSTGCSNKKADLSFTLKDMNGADVRLADYKGKVVLLNFWGTWCPPCRAEIPDLIEVANTYKDRGLVVLGIAQEDTPEDLKKFAAEYKMNYPSLLSTAEIEEAYGPMFAVPMTFIVDRSGAICFKQMGPVTKELVVKAIQPLL